MKIAMFDTHRYDREAFEEANVRFGHELSFLEPRLTKETATLASGHPAVCSFVNDKLDLDALQALRAGGTRLVALRSAGYNHVDLAAAARLGLPVVRVPEYSPYAVAEHAVALVLALNRKIHRAHARVREWNFSLDGLVGFDLHGKTVGVVGTGRIGRVAARIFQGFGCRLLGYDFRPDQGLAAELGLTYVELPELFRQADIVSLHVPLTPATHHVIDAAALASMKPGVLVVNTSRGALIDSRALIKALKSGHVAGAGLDVYEEEEGIFFQDLSGKVLQDDVLARLLSFPNVLITAHQAFLTKEALANIAQVTLANISAFEKGQPLENEVRAEEVLRPR
ncbi:MAG: 2-hydroxyacid dehydrogenase [Deltaproteobacteria bacterium]|nr:2-hydroxyacid dehydrogenase [Deltaproteobacteria bacterium]